MSLNHNPEGQQIATDPELLVTTATHESLNGNADWSVNMQIVDLINIDNRFASPILEVLKRKLQSKKHPKGLLAVILLETLVKNCPSILPLVGNREFMDPYFVKTIPKSVRDPLNKSIFSFNKDSDKEPLAQQRWQRILYCIQSWALQFQSQADQYPIFFEQYRKLQRKGVKFPEMEKEKDAPVLTPPRSIPPRQQLSNEVSAQVYQDEDAALAAALAASAAEAGLAPPRQAAAAANSAVQPNSSLQNQQATSRIVSSQDLECHQAHETASLLTQCLSESDPHADLRKDELVQTLYIQAKSAQAALASRLQMSAHESIMVQLLAAHEAISAAIEYYNGLVNGTMIRKKTNPIQPSAPQMSQSSALQEHKSRYSVSEQKDSGRAPASPFSQQPSPFSSSVSQSQPSAVSSPLDFFSGAAAVKPTTAPVAAAAAVSVPAAAPTPASATAAATSSSSIAAEVVSPPRKTSNVSAASSPAVPRLAPPPEKNTTRDRKKEKRQSISDEPGAAGEDIAANVNAPNSPTNAPAAVPSSNNTNQNSAAGLLPLDLLLNDLNITLAPAPGAAPSQNSASTTAAPISKPSVSDFDFFASAPAPAAAPVPVVQAFDPFAPSSASTSSATPGSPPGGVNLFGAPTVKNTSPSKVNNVAAAPSAGSFGVNSTPFDESGDGAFEDPFAAPM